MAEETTTPTPAASTALQGIEYQGDEFAALLRKEFKPKSDPARSAVEAAVLTLAQQALANTELISTDALTAIESMIAELDKRLSAQVNAVMHHADFQQMESAWRGLSYLVNNTETDEMLKINVFNVSKKDLHGTLKKYKGTAWDQSPLFKKVYEEEYGLFGGEPYGCLVGDYYFDHGPQDVELLGEMSKVSAAAFTPFIAAASPMLMQMDSWQELANPRDLTKIFGTPEYASWRSLARRRTRATSAWRCRASSRACPTAPRPARSRSSTSRKRPPAARTPTTRGRTPPTRWPSTSTARSRCTAGARASAASNRAVRSRACRRTRSRPTRAASR